MSRAQDPRYRSELAEFAHQLQFLQSERVPVREAVRILADGPDFDGLRSALAGLLAGMDDGAGFGTAARQSLPGGLLLVLPPLP